MDSFLRFNPGVSLKLSSNDHPTGPRSLRTSDKYQNTQTLYRIPTAFNQEETHTGNPQERLFFILFKVMRI